MKTLNKPAFKKGDIVKSAPNSSDIKAMGAVWNAIIYKYKGQTKEGHHVYETLGCWEPIKDEKGKIVNENKAGVNLNELWKDYKADWKKPELRQLWGKHLIANPKGPNS